MLQYLLLLETDREKEFFTSIYTAHREEMFFIAYDILHNNADAEDIVHESFLSLIDHVDKIIDKEPYQAWQPPSVIILYTAAWNFNPVTTKSKNFAVNPRNANFLEGYFNFFSVSLYIL